MTNVTSQGVSFGVVVAVEFGMCGLLDKMREQTISVGNEPGRVDRALALVAGGGLGDAIDRYGTTLTVCSCADRRFGRAGRCTHQLALIIAARLRRRFAIEGRIWNA